MTFKTWPVIKILQCKSFKILPAPQFEISGTSANFKTLPVVLCGLSLGGRSTTSTSLPDSDSESDQGFLFFLSRGLN